MSKTMKLSRCLHPIVIAFFALLSSAPSLAANSYTDTNNLKSQYFYQNNKSNRLVVFFHGDGGAKKFESSAKTFSRIAKEKKFDFLAVQAPGGKNWHDNGWEHGQWVSDLLRNVRKPKKQHSYVIFAGISGGAVFIQGQFLPLFGAEFRGGALLLCGGAPSLISAGADITMANYGEDPKKTLSIYLAINRGDYIFKQASAGIKAYKAFGMKVHEDILNGKGHCQFDRAKRFKKGIEKITSTIPFKKSAN